MTSVITPTRKRERLTASSVALTPAERTDAARLLRDLATLLATGPARSVLLDLARAVEQGSDLSRHLDDAARRHYGRAA